jgi:hypothetical protein
MACTPAILADLASSDIFYRWLNTQQAAVSGANAATLTTIAATLQAYSNCLIERTGSTSTPAIETENALKRTKIMELTTTINQRQHDVQVSQDRALLVRHPEMSRSYYESILPIGRPLSHYTIPILVGISTFLLSLSFFMLLSMIKVDARLLVPIMSSARTPYSTPFWMMSGVAVILLGLIIYAFTR